MHISSQVRLIYNLQNINTSEQAHFMHIQMERVYP
jgi:hypothetical protein